MTKTFTKSISLTLVFAMLIAAFSVFGLQASAATTYDAMTTRTITVETKKTSWWESDPYIRFTCYSDWDPDSAYLEYDAPKLSLKIVDLSNGRTSWARVTGTRKEISSKLKLEGGKKYRITVSYLYDKSINQKRLIPGSGYNWNLGHWYIEKTSKLASYSIK